MKKIGKLFVFAFLLCVCVGILNVNAACGSGVTVGNEFICLVGDDTQSVANGTAYSENRILVLENYNGGRITYTNGLGGYGPVTIKLIGDNYITANDSYGLAVLPKGVNFIGDGTLTITSKLPIVTFDPDKQDRTAPLADNVNTIKIVAGNGSTKETTNDATIENNENANTKNVEVKEELDLTLILVIVCCCVSVTSLLFVIITNSQKQKK